MSLSSLSYVHLRLKSITAALTLAFALALAAPSAHSALNQKTRKKAYPAGQATALPDVHNGFQGVPKPNEDEFLFGAELDFVNRTVANGNYGQTMEGESTGSFPASDENMAARDRWAEMIKKLCAKRGDCEVEAVREEFYMYDRETHEYNPDGGGGIWVSENWDGEEDAVKYYKIKYKDGWSWTINIDPGVVEVQLSPLRESQWEANVPRLQQDVYDTAHRAGLHIESPGNTHYHMGAESAFKGDLLKFRNWLVDRINHQELGLLFAPDLDNAPPLSKLSKEKWEAFARIILDIDSGKIKTIIAAAARLRREVYNVTHNTLWREDEAGENKTAKYQGENTTRVTKNLPEDARTTETRYLPAAKSARDLVDWIRLQGSRTHWLNSLNDRVVLWRFNPGAPRASMATNFRRWVEESGKSWKKYRRFLPSEDRDSTKREYSATALESQGPTVCVSRSLEGLYIPIDWGL